MDGKDILLRWSSLAADQGPSVCLRLLVRDLSDQGQSLEQLGYLPEQIRLIERAMMSQGGAVVFAGTVGSGKSTTLAALIAGLSPQRKVITIEDPVEYLIPDAIQNTVVRNLNAAAHEGYAAKLRALKRSAMDDVLLGEIRDQETGRAFMDLAGSGVNVYTTTHAPSAALIPDRLASDFIGISRDFLATPGILKLLVYQALLPVLCKHCALPASCLLEGGQAVDGQYKDGVYWRLWLARISRLYACTTQTLKIRNPKGCPSCHRPHLNMLDGYSGRTVVSECIEPALAPGFLQGVANQATAGVSRFDPETLPGTGAHNTGTGSAMSCAMQKALWGQIDPRQIEARFQSFETLELMQALMSKDRPLDAQGAGLPRLRAVP